MTDDEQQSELSRELEKTDRRIRIERLKKEAEEISGGEMVTSGSEEDEDSPVVEEFWERVLEFEKAPRGTRFAQLHEAGVALPPPDSLSDAELHGKLWEVINKLAEMRVFLYHTDHLSDRELYALLWDGLLREETVIMPPDPGSACHLDIIGSGSEADIAIGLKYYDDEEERALVVPETKVRYRSFPDTATLIEIAIREKRHDDVLRWYGGPGKRGGYWQDHQGEAVAAAVQETHPDAALAIWLRMAKAQIAMTKPAAYQTAGACLAKMQAVYRRTGRTAEWDRLITALRAENARKPRMIEVLDGLEGKRSRILAPP
ncbi:MAG: hypothetical protein FJ225_11465 [Lentisphaerae bacterium]|nr:hypothetical protein [Lentisphaerota bacterium]